MEAQFIVDPNLTIQSSHQLFWLRGNHLLVRENELLHSYQSVQSYCHNHLSIVPIGLWQGAPCFVVVDQHYDLQDSSFEGGEFLPLRSLLGLVSDSVFAFAGRALQLGHWWLSHQYCGRCGSATQLSSKELAMTCEQCEVAFFPPISPCVIGLIHRGDQVLLAHNARFTEGLYSALAGFIEPGETAEQALAREVFEEVGLKIKNIRYVESQSWPFPSQLMLGFFAEYDCGDIQVDGDEILHADWFGFNEIPKIPPAVTLSGKLIRQHFQSKQT